MVHRLAYAFWTLAVITLLTLPARGQAVISTRSGVIHYFEGAVYLGDQPLESHPGKFPTLPQGSELRTEEGRAEVLLTPGAFVRIGERSAIRMIANNLSDTRVELLGGSAIVDERQPSPGTAVTLIYRNWSVHFLEQGAYRIDSNPPRLWVLKGKAEVSSASNEAKLSVGQGMDVPFAPVLVPNRSINEPRDALSNWVEGRQESIAADDTIAANIQDPASLNPSNAGPDPLTYFPLLGLPSLGPGWGSPYSSLNLYQSLYQPGFNSIYLPGYTYLPVFVGVVFGPAYPTSFPPPHGGILPVPTPFPRPIPVSPVLPHPIPGRPIGPHPIPGHAMHGGIHR